MIIDLTTTLEGQMGPVLYYGIGWDVSRPNLTTLFSDLGLDTKYLTVPWAIPNDQKLGLPRTPDGELMAQLIGYNPRDSVEARAFLEPFSLWNYPIVGEEGSFKEVLKIISFFARGAGFYAGLFHIDAKPSTQIEDVLVAAGELPVKLFCRKDYQEGLNQGKIVRSLVILDYIQDLFVRKNTVY